jgi:hypothetical protein
MKKIIEIAEIGMILWLLIISRNTGKIITYDRPTKRNNRTRLRPRIIARPER